MNEDRVGTRDGSEPCEVGTVLVTVLPAAVSTRCIRPEGELAFEVLELVCPVLED